jgi:peptide/nickel transport system substrate-binding protein
VSRRGGQLVRNRYFRSWSPRNRPAGFADRIEISVRPDDAMATQIADVERGAADVAVLADPFHSYVQPEQLAALTARAPGQLHRSPVATTSFMFLNVRMRPFDDLRVRRAVNHATDRARVGELTASADVAMPTCQFVPPALRGYEPYCRYGTLAGPSNRWKAADRERARRLIAASGRAGERVVVWTPPSEKAIGRYFVNLLDELGFRASLHVPGTVYAYFDQLLGPRTHAQIGFNAFTADYLSASNLIEPFFACPQGAKRSIWNWSYFCDPGVTQEIEQALGSEGAEAAGHWAAADRRIADRSPARGSVDQSTRPRIRLQTRRQRPAPPAVAHAARPALGALTSTCSSGAPRCRGRASWPRRRRLSAGANVFTDISRLVASPLGPRRADYLRPACTPPTPREKTPLIALSTPLCV